MSRKLHNIFRLHAIKGRKIQKDARTRCSPSAKPQPVQQIGLWFQFQLNCLSLPESTPHRASQLPNDPFGPILVQNFISAIPASSGYQLACLAFILFNECVLVDSSMVVVNLVNSDESSSYI